ncbi:hypothetical protein HY312_01665 [Candidatus Saccharibacteria bacterium]|nr:hypothetical protein [Candidatus Saccharibacteria bacterium]
MPELPEVETVRRGLHELIIGRAIKNIDHDTEKSFPNAVADVQSFLINASIADVRRRAKVLMIDLSTAYTLVIHLKMTGQLVYRGDSVFGAGHPNDSLSLWGAKIHPKRLVNTITQDEFVRLYTELREVMNLAIEKGGSTDKNYVNAEGKRGSYMDFARVFRREGLACPRCGTEIIKFKAAGRGTHICPYCQVL